MAELDWSVVIRAGAAGLLAYLLGSLPFAYWMTHRLKGTDIRQAGSGHSTATNTIRQAGWAAGIVVMGLDALKGYLAVTLAEFFGGSTLAVILASGLVVAGHCWPVFLQFRGGMGLATTAGAYLAVTPFGFLMGLGFLIALTLALHHSARASVISGILIGPLFALIGMPERAIWMAAVTGAVIAVRFSIDWKRKYRELWLDRA